LLRGVLSDRRPRLRPPWSLEEARFLAGCTACGECIPVCPTGVLQRDEDGRPMVDFSDGACSFCGHCARACHTGSLSLRAFLGMDPWPVKALVSDRCVNRQGVLCRECGSACSDQAIRFAVTAQGVLAEVDEAVCTGCGACYRACPKRAIEMRG
jgi:ferredoxin-type protein NapF